jgi:hypothetical protein
VPTLTLPPIKNFPQLSTPHIQNHPHLVLLVVVAHHGKAPSAQQVPVHELAARLKVAAQADAQQREVAASWEEVAALQEAGLGDLAADRQAWGAGGRRLGMKVKRVLLSANCAHT